MRAHRGLIIAGLILTLVLVIAGALLYLRLIGFNAYRSVIVSRIESITGRDVAINGDLDVTLSLTPTLILEEVTLGNASWGSRDTMARIERVELEIQLLPLLLDGDVRVKRLIIIRPDVLLETDVEGNGNWEFNQGRAPGGAAKVHDYGEFLLEHVMIVDGTVIWRGPASDAADPLQIDRFIWQANDVTSRVSVRGVGTYRSLPIQFEGTVGPYRVGGRLTDPGEAYQIEEIDARIGRSRIGGRLLLALPADGGRMRIEGALSSERLDLEPFLEIAFAPTDERADSGRVFSDEPFDPAFLRAADASVTLRASLVTFAGAELQDVMLDLALDRGRLAVEPFAFRVADGRSEGRFLLDAGAEPLRVATRFEVRRVDVAKLLSWFIASETVSGRAGLSLDLTSAGQSPHALMAALDGSALLVMRSGRVAGTQLDRLVTDLDLLKLLPPFWDWSPEDSVEIVCLVGQAAIDAGRASTKILLDTRRMTLVGTGVVDLGAETLDLALVPKPKSDKLSTVAVPVDIEGRFADIQVKPQTDVAVGRSVAGLLGGLLVPLNLLASLVGDEAGSACLEAIQAGGGVPGSGNAGFGGSPREE